MSRLIVSLVLVALAGQFTFAQVALAQESKTAIVRLAGDPVPPQPDEGSARGRLGVERAYRARFAASSQGVLAQIALWQKEAREARAQGKTVTRDVSDVTELWTCNALVVRGTDSALTALAGHQDVVAVLPDRPHQLLPTRQGRAGRQDAYTWGLLKIGADRAQTQLHAQGDGVVVGILDTGIDAEHPDLKGKVLKFKSFVNTSDPNTPNDGHGHGTHTAGTIAGGNAGGTQIGVAPHAKLVVGQIFNASGSTTDAAILAAMAWIADPDGNPNTNDAPALCSNSWGGSPGTEAAEKPLWDSVQAWVRLGIFPSFAAGNEGPGVSTMGTPGGYPHSFAAGATDTDDKIAYFSSRGPISWSGVAYTKPDVSAPGVDVYSAKPGGGYQTMDGTSMACPHVSGTAALIYALHPDYTIAQVSQLLRDTSIDLGAPGNDNVFGQGRINAFAAVQIAANGGKISVKLTDENGQPIAGRVSITGGAVTQIASSGATSLVLVAGSYTLVASAFGYLDSAPLTVQVAAGQSVDAAFTLKSAPAGKLVVTVKDAVTGAPLPGKVSVADAPVTEAATDPATGLASLSVPYGTYTLKVRAFAHEIKTLEKVKVDAAQVTVDATLAHLPDILLYDRDMGKPYENVYKATLTAMGKPFSYLEATKDADAETLSAFPVLVYFTGDQYQGTVSDAMQATLKNYLASGGRVLITGQDIGYDLKTSPFLADVLHAKFVKDAATSRDVAGSGLTFSIAGGDGANNQKYPDVIEAVGQPESLFAYGGGEGPAGLLSTVGTGKVAYLPFGFEAIDTAAHRQAALDLLIKKLTPTAKERAARLEPLTRQFGPAAGDLYRAYLVDWYEHQSHAAQEAARGMLRGLSPQE